MSGKLLEIMQKQHILRMELHASDRQHAAAAVVFVHCTETTKTVNKRAETRVYRNCRNLDGENSRISTKLRLFIVVYCEFLLIMFVCMLKNKLSSKYTIFHITFQKVEQVNTNSTALRRLRSGRPSSGLRSYFKSVSAHFRRFCVQKLVQTLQP